MSNGIISKDRVKEHGEVFTPDNIVNDMLDLLDNKDYSSIFDKTYLEPSCGDGQFLVRILFRKMKVIENMPINEREVNLLKALSTIYGIDIQYDNVLNSIDRLFRLATGQDVETFTVDGTTTISGINLGIEYTDILTNCIRTILENNIICGNALTGNLVDGGVESTKAPIIIREYKFNGDEVSVYSYKFDDLNNPVEITKNFHYLDLYKMIVRKSVSEAEAEDEAGTDDF